MDNEQNSFKKKGDARYINLHVADPYFDTPQPIKEMMIHSLSNGFTHYSSTIGLESFRKAIASFYDKEFSVRINPSNEVIPTNGAGEGLYLILHSLFEPGDEIIIPNPTYHGFLKKVKHSSLVAKFVPMFLAKTENFDINSVSNAITDKTKAIYICNPNNPTGTVLRKEDMDKISILLEKNNKIMLIVDKCYSRILYEGAKYYEFLSYDKIRDQILVVDSFSKTYAMTGWRIGYIIGTESNIAKVAETAFDVRSSVNTAIQEVAAQTISIKEPFVKEMVYQYSKRRHLILSFLKENNIGFFEPHGGFEVFVDISRFGLTSTQFAEKIQDMMHVKVVSGSEFGPNGEGYIRIVFCVAEDELKEGLLRIRQFISTLDR